jgi:protein phosphatase
LDVDIEKKPGTAPDMKLVAVADGAGGMAAGKIASNITVRAVKHSVAGSVADSIEQLASEAEDDPYASWLAAAVKAANFLVHLQAQQHQAKMASTLVMALIEGEQVHIANVGDSRAYVVNEYGLRQITQDHSAAQELLNAGLIRYDEVKGHPFEHVLTRAIGPEEDVEPDLFREYVRAGDRLLLCTDGLTNMITEAQIWEIVHNAPDPQTAAQQLIDAANKSGGKDNITAVVVEIQQ